MNVLVFAAWAILIGEAHAQSNATLWTDLNAEGIRLIGAGDYAAAETKFGLALVEAGTFGEQDFRLWTNLSNLAMTRREQGDAEGAEALYRRVLQFQEQSLPPESAEIAATLNNIGESLYVAGRAQQADPLLRRGLVIAQNAHDDMVIATTLNTLGLVLSALGEDARAEPVLRRAIALFERIDGPDSFNTGKAANNLASVYSKQGEIGKAAELQRRALPIYQRNLAPGDPLLATVMNNMAVLLMAQKQADQAEPYLRDALEIAERSSSDTLQTQQVRANLASLEAGRGNWRAAATLLEKVVAAEERVVGLNHPRLASSLANYSVALKHINHKAEAKQAERRANAILKSFRQNLHAFATRR